MPTAISPASFYRRLWQADLLPVLVLAALTAVVFQLWPLDLDAARALATAEPPAKCFTLQDSVPWIWFYRHIGWIVAVPAVAAMGFLGLAAFRPALRRYRLHALIVILSLALGPGVLVNVILKDHWGRPRPRDVKEFGGRWEYSAPLSRGVSGRGKSFPCGHSSAGYALAVTYFLFRRKRPALAALSLLFALLLGSALGFARMAAGAHFLSDVLWSFYLTWLVSWLLYYFVFKVPGREDAGTPEALRLNRPLVIVGFVLVLGLVGGGLFASPVYKEFDALLPYDDVRLFCGRAEVTLRIVETDAVAVSARAEGFGPPWSAVYEADMDCFPPCWALVRRGWFTELGVHVEITAPADGLSRLRVSWQDGAFHAEGPAPLYPVELEHRNGTLDLPPSWQSASNIRVQSTLPAR